MSDKVPKPILAVREKMAKLGLPITAENMQLHLSSGDINKAAGALRTALKNTSPDKAAAYRGLKRADQREWLATFAIDASVSRCVASESSSRSTVHTVNTKIAWLTISQLASDVVFASQEDAEIYADAAAPEDRRPCKYKSLAAKGREEFRIELDDEQFKKLFKSETKLEARADTPCFQLWEPPRSHAFWEPPGERGRSGRWCRRGAVGNQGVERCLLDVRGLAHHVLDNVRVEKRV